MKKIGYIYKYSNDEGKGILVHGRWKSRMIVCGHEKIQDLPIKFIESDCLSQVKTGDLVYFNLSDCKASCIEKANLKNFDPKVIENLLKQEEKNVTSDWYFDRTHISWEDLSDIIIPEKTSNESSSLINNNIIDDESIDLIDFDDEEEDDDSDYISYEQTDLDLPVTIDELFDCFGKYTHRTRRFSLYGLSKRQSNVINFDILDLSLWTDIVFSSESYYGSKTDEIKFLYDVFVRKVYFKQNGEKGFERVSNDCISNVWQTLLLKFDNTQLKEILTYAPKLQPALPKEFCKKNAGLLTDDYGMPDVETCKLHCLHKISNAETVSEYKDIKHRLFVYCHCGEKHLEGEGTPMCQMGKRRINNLEKRLDLQYESVIKQKIISQLSDLSTDANAINEIQIATPDDLNKVGLFIENYHVLKTDFLGYEVCEKTFESYEKLPQVYKDALKTSLHNCINEAAISATKAEHLSPFLLGYQVEERSSWILESTKQHIKELVNERFSNLDDLGDLNYAYKYDYITSKQYFKRYKQLTNDFNTHQFLEELTGYKMEDSPLTIQWYVVSNIIKQLGYNSLSSSNYVKLDYYDAINGIENLLKWLDKYGHLKDIIKKKAENMICSVLTKNERWTLFQEKIVKSPGEANIRIRLDKIYKKKAANKELLKNECFQDVMLSDVDYVKDTEILLFIADHLDKRHQYLMQQKATGFLKLYLWQKQPSGKLDWDLVKSHFHEMSAEAQIRTLRYIFGQMASGESALIVDDLYEEFVETTNPACPAVCGVLYLLKAKKDDINISITPAMVETVIGEDLKQRFNFLKDSKDLFYPCNGYLAITQNHQDIEYQSFNGILKKEIKDNTLFYVITFHDTPVNLFGRTIEWLDSEEVDTAIQVLKRNCDVEIVNGNYYIPESQEFFVKQFVIAYDIDDKCGLVSDKERMIELGYLPRNNAFQPLYTNGLRKYEDSEHYICRCGCKGGSDPNNSFPFYWCKKKICARRAHFFLPSSEWEKFRFADFLFIALGQNSAERESVWLVNAEISQFICDYTRIFKSSERNISSSPLNELEEKGTWDKDSSTYRDIYDDDEYGNEEYDDGDYDNYSHDYEEPTYDRYNGSYAQDEMGYSDDDIETIFDGDPDAYWNID